MPTRLPVFPRAAVEQDAWRPRSVSSVIGEEGVSTNGSSSG